MCLIDEVGERNTFKNKKSVSTLGVTDNVCVTVLSYEYKCPTSLYSCEFEKKSGWSNSLNHLLTYWTPGKIMNLVSPMIFL